MPYSNSPPLLWNVVLWLRQRDPFSSSLLSTLALPFSPSPFSCDSLLAHRNTFYQRPHSHHIYLGPRWATCVLLPLLHSCLSRVLLDILMANLSCQLAYPSSWPTCRGFPSLDYLKWETYSNPTLFEIKISIINLSHTFWWQSPNKKKKMERRKLWVFVCFSSFSLATSSNSYPFLCYHLNLLLSVPMWTEN